MSEPELGVDLDERAEIVYSLTQTASVCDVEDCPNTSTWYYYKRDEFATHRCDEHAH